MSGSWNGSLLGITGDRSETFAAEATQELICIEMGATVLGGFSENQAHIQCMSAVSIDVIWFNCDCT